MKPMEDLRKKDVETLQGELLSLRREYFNLRMQSAAQQNKRTSEFQRVRRTIARVLTLLGERRREEEAQS